MQSSRRRWMPVVALWGSLLAMAVQAAPAEQGAAAPQDLSACLVRPAVHKGLQQLVDAGEVGTVGARLVFSKPDAPPRIEWLADPVSAEVQNELQFYFRDFRLPCMSPAQAPVALTQRIVLTANAAKADAARRAPAQGPDCLTRRMGDFPDRYTTAVGKALIRLSFERPGAPSSHQVLYASPDFNDRPLIADFAKLHQLTCPVQGKAFEAEAILIMAGSKRIQFEAPLKFKDFLPLVKDWRKQTFDFDLNAMGCPFDLRWDLRQPHAENGVTELGERNAARAPLLQWLARQTLRTQSAEEYDSVVLEPMTLQVPCGRLKYTPPS